METMSDAQDWEKHYQTTPVAELPWNAGKPDEDLVRLVKSGRIPIGQALDIGTGPGHDAVFLIHSGFFHVVAIDISPTAVKLARANASAAGLFGFFQQADVRRLPMEDGFFDFANDRGCFHTLDAEDRTKAINEIHRVLAKKGLFLLHVFSDKQPPGPGPHRFSRKELEDLFQPKFRILDLWEKQFEVPSQPKSYSLLMEKK
jgi:SAM-dependent methyltransferase